MRRSEKRALETPFPEAWRRLLARMMPQWTRLSPDERARMEDLIRRFLVDKIWEGPHGTELEEDVRVTVAGHACLLVLGLDVDWFRNVTSIIVHPATVVRRGQRNLGGGISTLSPAHLAGEALLHGPVMLTWDAVRDAGYSLATGRNVVHHEFAHKLDMLDGFADGSPPVGDRSRTTQFQDVVVAGYERLLAGDDPVLDPYGATNHAEFFAVATEAFFSKPHAVATANRELFDALLGFYRWDPTDRLST